MANTDVVTATVLSGGGTVSGTTTSTASSGVSTFTALLYVATADQQAFVLRFTDDASGTNAFNGTPVDASSTTSNVVATKFLVTLATTTAVAGSADTLTLTAANAGDVTDTGYSATGKTYTFVDASSTALSAHVPANTPATAPTIPSSSTIQAAFSSGVASLTTFTLTKAEVLGTITASDGTLNGTSTSVTVRHTVASAFVVSASTATPTAGTAFNLTVLARDASGNTASGANGGTVYASRAFISTSATTTTPLPVLNPSSYIFVSGDAGTKTLANAVTLNVVENGVTITAQNIDGTITGTVSSLNVSASADTTAPTVTNVAAGSITSSSVSITWTTSETVASSTIDYGTTLAYGSSNATTTSGTSHTLALTGLTANTTYHFRVKSDDSAGNRNTQD
ncbi:MAG: fibronectin type III domain-containing protein, partial [Patescibacteria group bacterium]